VALTPKRMTTSTPGKTRLLVAVFIVVAILVTLVLALTVLSDSPAIRPEDPPGNATRVDDGDIDLAAAAAEALTRKAVPISAVPGEGDDLPVHRRAANTHEVARVIDRDTGAPVPGARVEFFTSHLLRSVWHRETLLLREPVAVAESEADGSVWLPKSLRGVLHVDVAGPEHHATEFVRIELPGGPVSPTEIEAARGGRVRGMLVTRSLEPVAPARVMAMPDAAAMIDVMQGGHLTLRTARVLADGSYELLGIPAGANWRIAALDGTFWPTQSAAFAIGPGDEVSIDIVVTAARTLHGRVRNQAGEPVADALVSYTTKAPKGIDGYDLMARYAAARRQTWTDTAGRFALPGVPAAKVHIWAVHDLYGASERRAVDLRPAKLTDVHLVLDGAAVLRGRVVDAVGNAIADADVTWLGPKSRKRPLLAEERTVTRSGADGAFSLPCPSTDAVVDGNILVRCEGYARAIEPVSVPSERTVEVVLQPGRAITGVVTAKSTGEPVPEFSLLLDVPKALRGLGRLARGDRALRFRSAKGQFRTEPEFGGTLELTVEAAGFDTMTMTVDLAVGGDAPLLFELEPALVLAGDVVDAAGVPIPDANVEASGWKMTGIFRINATSDAQRCRTDATGRFEMPGVRPNKDKYIHIHHDDYLPLHNQRVRASDGGFARQRFVLRRGGAIAGAVTSSNGHPCQQAEVVCLSIAGNGALQRATADGAGNYRLEGLDPDLAYDLAVLAPGTPLDMRGLFAAVSARGVNVAAGEVTHVDLTLDTSGNSRVRGRVSFGDGMAVAGATVMLLDDDAGDAFGLSGSRRTRTDADGQFEIDGVPVGDYVVAFGEMSTSDRNAARFGRESISVAAGETQDLDLVIATGELRGAVRDAHTGAAMSGVRVLVQSAATRGSAPHNAMLLRLESRRTNERGEFSFRAMAPGAYRLLALPPHGTPFAGASAGPFEIGPAHPTVEVAIALPRGVLVRARVHDTAGPVAGARLVLRAPGGALLDLPLSTNKNGELETSAVPEGAYLALVRESERVSTAQAVNVPASGTVQLEFVLPR